MPEWTCQDQVPNRLKFGEHQPYAADPGKLGRSSSRRRVALGVDVGDLLELGRLRGRWSSVCRGPRKRKLLEVWKDLAIARLVQELYGKILPLQSGAGENTRRSGTMLAIVLLQVQQFGGIICNFGDFQPKFAFIRRYGAMRQTEWRRIGESLQKLVLISVLARSSDLVLLWYCICWGNRK
jgi:hypothetical protein